MSLVPGMLKGKDPDAIRNAQFDWTAFLDTTPIASADVFVTGPDAALTVDNIITTNAVVDYRIAGGTPRKKYRVTCRITTSELSPQVEDKSIFVRISNG